MSLGKRSLHRLEFQKTQSNELDKIRQLHLDQAYLSRWKGLTISIPQRPRSQSPLHCQDDEEFKKRPFCVGYVRFVVVDLPQVDAMMFAADAGWSDFLKM